jgi:hypothetical protein
VDKALFSGCAIPDARVGEYVGPMLIIGEDERESVKKMSRKVLTGA